MDTIISDKLKAQRQPDGHHHIRINQKPNGNLMDTTISGSTKSSTATLWTPPYQDQLKAQREPDEHQPQYQVQVKGQREPDGHHTIRII